MPLIELTYPQDAIDDGARDTLAARLTDALMQCELSRRNPRARALIWTQFNPLGEERLFVAGRAAPRPHYRLDVTLMAGVMEAPVRASVVEAMTRAVLETEGSDFNPLNAGRVWVLFHEIPDGRWGGGGRLYTLDELRRLVAG